MAWSHIIPFAAAAGRFAWRHRYDIMRGLDMYSRHSGRRRRERSRRQAAYLRGYVRGSRRQTGRYARRRANFYYAYAAHSHGRRPMRR